MAQWVSGDGVDNNQLEKGWKGESGKLESKIPIHEIVDKKKMPNGTDEVIQGNVLIHERGKANQTKKSLEFTLPILGYKPVLEKESRGEGEDEMQWETMTAR